MPQRLKLTMNADNFNTTTTILATIDHINFHRQTTSTAIYYGLAHLWLPGTAHFHIQFHTITTHFLFTYYFVLFTHFPTHGHEFWREFPHFFFTSPKFVAKKNQLIFHYSEIWLLAGNNRVY